MRPLHIFFSHLPDVSSQYDAKEQGLNEPVILAWLLDASCLDFHLRASSSGPYACTFVDFWTSSGCPAVAYPECGWAVPWSSGGASVCHYTGQIKAATTRGHANPYVVCTWRTNGPISFPTAEGDFAEIYGLLQLRHCFVRINLCGFYMLWNPYVLGWHIAVEKNNEPLEGISPLYLAVMDDYG